MLNFALERRQADISRASLPTLECEDYYMLENIFLKVSCCKEWKEERQRINWFFYKRNFLDVFDKENIKKLILRSLP